MEAKYINRYGDEILFKQVSEDTIEMSGYLAGFLRCGFANDWSESYDIYCIGKENPLDFLSFVDKIESALHEKESEFHSYVKYGTYATDYITMVDPSGGPMINVGDDLTPISFKDEKERIVREIKIVENNIVLLLI